MKVVGIDIGSRDVKLICNEDGIYSEGMLFSTASFYRDYCQRIDGKLSLDIERLSLKEIDKIACTGYGRNNVNLDGCSVIIELKAHLLGAIKQTGLKDFTLLDVGGQDSKIIAVKSGKMKDMILNDKCAASCGRYVENMANVMGISLDEISKYYENPIPLSATCAVFAESELIGKISEGVCNKDLAAGVNYSLYKRIKPLLDRFKNDTLVVTGGVAFNKGFIQVLKKEAGFSEVVVPSNPQLNGAIGCCEFCINVF